MDTEDTGSGKEDEPEQEVNSEQEEEEGAGPSTSAGSNSQSSNRQMRNMAEKMRRDKLNFFINELSTLVPIISFSPKKLDKTSILRLAATYIRLHNVIFGSVRGESRRSPSTIRQTMEYLPQYLASFNWSENVLEEMDGMLMIVNGAGRIIFISHTIEKLLGHTQIELMGQSLYNLTCLEDYDELKRNLTPEEDLTATGSTAPDDSSSDSSNGTTTPPPRLPSLPFHLDVEGGDQRLRRSFYIRLRQRAQSRGDQPHYELVHIMGHLRVPPRRPQPSTSHQLPNHNDIILVAVVKPFKEKRITSLSLMEACKEEFITRHTLDGRIVYTDHRISTVAGYMAEEVCGVPGFQYMHKDDMRWTMVGLRQMFYRGSSYGQSCYRLQSKNGAFIYLKTCGYLELSENNKNFQSLICINSLVSVQEGETLMRQMKDLFSPVIRVNNDPNMEMLSNNIDMAESNTTTGQTEDPDIMAEEIKKMISNVPNQSAFLTNIPSPSSSSIGANEEGYGKVTLLAKAMPSLETHLSIAQERKKMEIVPTMIKTPAALAASLSPQSSHSHHSPPHPPTPPQLTPPPPVCPQQNRPSVLRVAHRQGDHVVLQPSVVKLKRLRTDEQGQEVVMSQASMSPHSVVVSPASSGGKRKSEDSNDWPSPLQVDVSSPASNVHAPTPAQPLSVSPPFQLETVAVEQLLTSVDDSVILPDFRMIPDEGSPPSLANNNLEDIELSDMYNFPFAWPPPAVPEMLDSSHRSLDSQIQLQQEQIHEIQQELDLVPPEHTNGQVYNTKLSQLQVEHRKQQQMLKTLQQDHQNIQHLGVCSNHQNVGI